MNLDKLAKESYIEWFSDYYGVDPSNYGKDDLPEELKDQPDIDLFLMKFAQDISLITVRKYHEQLAAELKKHGIALDTLETSNTR